MDERRKVVWIKKFTHLGKRPTYACSKCLHVVKKKQQFCFHRNVLKELACVSRSYRKTNQL